MSIKRPAYSFGNDLQIEEEALSVPGTVVVHLRGVVDAHTFQPLEEHLNTIFAGGRQKIVIDLAGIEYVSSAGIGVFVSAHASARERQGNLVLLAPTAEVQEVFNILDLGQLVFITQDRAEAIRQVQAPAEEPRPKTQRLVPVKPPSQAGARNGTSARKKFDL